MSQLNDLKLALIEKILAENKMSHLQAIQQLLADQLHTVQDHSRIVGLHPNGTRISKKALLERIRFSLQDIDEGRVTPIDSLENESEQW